MSWFRRSHDADYADPSAEAPPKKKESLPRFLITRSMARLLFGVSPRVWKRWRRFEWLPQMVSVEGKKRYRQADIEHPLSLDASSRGATARRRSESPPAAKGRP